MSVPPMESSVLEHVGRKNDDMEFLIRELLTQLGEDPDRDGLARTPERVRKSLEFLTGGYRQDLAEILNGAVFQEAYSEMVLVRDIEYYSLCEHHLLPFFGKCHVAYLPDGAVVGLSKIPRIVGVFSRRLQVQERLTTQIAECIDGLVRPRGVAVVMEGTHLCMAMRGVQKQATRTTTSALLGSFRDDLATRTEFMNLIR